YSRAKVVVALDCDFLGSETGAIRNQRLFAQRRRLLTPDDGQNMSRLYVVEGSLSITGMSADHRLRLAPSRIDAYLRALAAALSGPPGQGERPVQLPSEIGSAVRDTQLDVPAAWLAQVAADLRRNPGAAVVVVGRGQP